MEKIKLSLWDIFVFISSAIVLHLAFTLNEIYVVKNDFVSLDFTILKDREFIFLIIGLIYFFLFGKIWEPIANEIYNGSVKLIGILKSKCCGGEKQESTEIIDLRNEVAKKIKEKTHLEKIDRPYHFVKDYLTDEGRSYLFQVFLSRYGFYRNCYSVCLMLIIRNLFQINYTSVIVNIGYSVLLILYFRRTKQFLEYQEPTLYRTYLMGD